MKNKTLQILGSEIVVKTGFILLISLTITSIWWNPPLSAWMKTHSFLGDLIYFDAVALAILLIWGPGYVRYVILQKGD